MNTPSVAARVFALVVMSGVTAFSLTACTSDAKEAEAPAPQVDAPLPRPEPGRPSDAKPDSSGGGMFGMFGSSGDTHGVGVNEFLWRATLDTLHFIPMENADPFA